MTREVDDFVPWTVVFDVLARQRDARKTPSVTCCFAFIPDGVDVPVAVFENLEDAMDWGVRKYGGGRFTIRHMPVTQSVPFAAKKAAASQPQRFDAPTADDPTRWLCRGCAPVLTYAEYAPLRCSPR